MKNITVAVPEDVFRAARIRAAERGTSLSALVGEYLRSLAGDGDFDRLAGEQESVRSVIGRFRGGDRLGREEVHERAVR